MSTFAAARVETKIVIQGEGNAAKVVGDVRKGLDGLDGAAGKAGKGVGGLGDSLADVAKVGRETSSRAGATFAGIASVLGGAVPEVAKLGQGFTAAGAAANLIPGPVGLAAAAVAAAAIGAYELNKHFSETAAKIANLGDSATQNLADRLHVSVDEAIKLQQAMDDLPARVRPSVTLLDLVRQRAESMGKNGAEAAAKFADALAKGPEALKAFEREFGRLSTVSADLPDVAGRLGLSRDALGIATQVGNEAERAKKSAEQAVAIDRERQALLTAAADAQERAGKATVVASIELQGQARELTRQADFFGVLAQKATDEANALQAVVDLQREATQSASTRARIAQVSSAEIAVLEAQGAAQLSKQDQLRYSIHTTQLRSAEVARQTGELETAYRAGLVSELQYRIELAGLQVQGFQIAAKEQATGKQAAADLQARRQKGQQIADAEAASKLRLVKIDAQTAEQSILTLGRMHDLKLQELALEERAELVKAQREVNTKAGHEANKLAIAKEYADKRRALDKAELDAIDATAAEGAKLLQEQAAETRAIADDTTAAVASAAKARQSSIANALRAAGKDEQADLVELNQAHADYEAQAQAINDKLIAQRDKFDVADVNYHNLEKQRLAALAEALQKFDDVEAQTAQRSLARKKESIGAALEQSVAGPAALLKTMGGASSKVADALSGVAGGAAQVARNWGDIGKAAPGAISAVGAVATAFVDSEREKAGVMAVMEAAAAIAAIAVEDYAGAAAHGAAAVLYGGIAAGAIGSTSSAPAAAGPGSFSDSGMGTANGGQAQQGQTTVININTPLTSKQDVAKGITQGLRSLRTTGYANAKGA